ncbi:MAG: alpha/beta hydrolase [Chitinophagales bacterium]
MQKKNLQFLFLVILTLLISSCNALLQAAKDNQVKQTTTQKDLGNAPKRAYTLTFPANKDRIPVGGYSPGEEMVTTPNTFGKRYKDYVFTDVEITTEIYKKNAPKWNGGTQNLVVDFVSPKNDPERKRPCILFMFGGGFVDKGDDCSQEIGKGMAQKGYVVALMDYRLGFPDGNLFVLCQGNFMTGFYEAALRATQDARSAIRYIKANANRLGIDPDKIFISGNSAGAITALNVALFEDKDIPATPLKDIGGSLNAMKDNLQFNSKVAGVISLAGAVIDKKLLDKATNTPICLFQGNCDNLIDINTGTAMKCDDKNATFPLIYGSQAIYDAMKTKNKIKFNYVCNGGHLTVNWGLSGMIELISQFTTSVLDGNPVTGKDVVNPVKKECNAACN